MRGRGEGTIHHRASDGRWVAGISPGPGRRREWLYGKTRREVSLKLDARRRELQLGMPGSTGLPRLKDYAELWLKDTATVGRTAGTVKRYGELLRGHVLPELGAVRLDKLSVAAVQELLTRKVKSKELSPQTVIHVRAALRALLNTAMRQELLGRNVAALAQPPPNDPAERGFLTVGQAKRLLEAVRGDRLEVLYTVGISLGMRPGEIRGLRWQDIDFEAGQLEVRMQMLERPAVLARLKTRASRRRLDLPEVTRAQLLAHKSRQAKEQLAAGKRWAGLDLVLADLQGQPVKANYLRRTFARALAAAGLPVVGLYDATRHSCASLLVSQNVHPKVAQGILGHAQMSTTMQIYSHVAPDSLKAGAEAVDRALR